jgi:hypothetical protein
MGPDRYGNTYNTESYYYLDRFDEVLKGKGRKSMFTEENTFTYKCLNENYANNKNMKFIQLYIIKDQVNKYQIEKSRRKISENKVCIRENLITTVENRIKHPP